MTETGLASAGDSPNPKKGETMKTDKLMTLNRTELATRAFLAAAILAISGGCPPPDEAVCGDGIVGIGEQCDPPGDDCDASCQEITGGCGNGEVEGDEECDSTNRAICNDDCTLVVAEDECGEDVEAGTPCVDLTIDSNNDLVISSADALVEERPPGKFIRVNNDDDNRDGVVDHTESTSTANEDDLVAVSIESRNAPGPASTWALDYPPTVTVWTSPDRTGPITNNDSQQFPLPAEVFVEGLAPSDSSGDVSLTLHLQDSSGDSLASDTVFLTSIEIKFHDAFPDYALEHNDGNGSESIRDSDNYFLRQDGDFNGLNIFYSVLPADIEATADIAIYQENGELVAQRVGETVNGAMRSLTWDAVDSSTGAFFDTGLFKIQIVFRALSPEPDGLSNELFATSIEDGDLGTDGWQCPLDGLAVHDLVWKHRPVVYMGELEIIAPLGPIYPFSDPVVENYRLFKESILLDGPVFEDSYSEFGADNSQLPHFPSVESHELLDPEYIYPVLADSVLGDPDDVSRHYIDVKNDARESADGVPMLCHRGHPVAHPNYVFIHYWMYETASFSSYNETGLLSNTYLHECDWELLQLCVQLSTPANPSDKRKWFLPHAATASQHFYGQTLAWRSDCSLAADSGDCMNPLVVDQRYVETQDNGNRVVVYIAENSHGTYFRSGQIASEDGDLGTQVQYHQVGTFYDQISGDLRPTDPGLFPLQPKSGMGIYDWNGKWGGTIPGLSKLAGPMHREARLESGAKLNMDGSPVEFHDVCTKLIPGGGELGTIADPEVELGDPCDEVVCSGAEACIRGQCVSLDPCDGFNCGDQETCVEGQCVALVSCGGTVCEALEVCVEGTCQPVHPVCSVNSLPGSESMTVIIHGTNPARFDEWYQPGGTLHDYLKTQFFDDLYSESDFFTWGGGTTDSARQQGADDLIAWAGQHPTKRLRLIGHSHGCTVISQALHKGLTVHEIVYLSPLWSGGLMNEETDYPLMTNVTIPYFYNIRPNSDTIVALADAVQDFPPGKGGDAQRLIIIPDAFGNTHAFSHEVDKWEEHVETVFRHRHGVMTAVGDAIYNVRGGDLHKIFESGSCSQLSPNIWNGTHAMTSIGSTLYIVKDDDLHAVDPPYVGFRKLNDSDGTWHHSQSMTSIGDTLYIVQNDNLYAVDPPYSSFRNLNDLRGTWHRTRAMTSIGDTLYIVQNDNLYAVDPPYNGSTRLNDTSGDWHHTQAMTAIGDALYIIQNGRLFRVDPPYNGFDELGSGDKDWYDSNSMIVIGDSLYINSGANLHRADAPYTGCRDLEVFCDN